MLILTHQGYITRAYHNVKLVAYKVIACLSVKDNVPNMYLEGWLFVYVFADSKRSSLKPIVSIYT